MTNAPTQTARDWLGSMHTNLLAWWLPHAAILVGLFIPVMFEVDGATEAARDGRRDPGRDAGLNGAVEKMSVSPRDLWHGIGSLTSGR